MRTVVIVTICAAIVASAYSAGSSVDAGLHGRAMTLGLLCFGNIGMLIALAIRDSPDA